MTFRLLGLPLLLSLAAAQPPAANDLPLDGLAMFKQWVPPVPPQGVALAQGGLFLPAVVEVGTDGRVLQARLREKVDPKIEAAFREAAGKWTFIPAMTENVPYVAVVELAVPFVSVPAAKRGARPPPPDLRPVPIKKPEVLEDVDAAYPDELNSRKLNGSVRFSCHLDAEGRRSQFVVMAATDVAFVAPAVAAVERWKIAPATAGPFTVPATFQGDVEFHANVSKNAEILAANGITAPDGSEPDAVPQLDEAPEPVYPLDLLLAGESGNAVVTFTVLGSGAIDALTLKSASKPEFGEALLAALQNWSFHPATQDGHGVEAPLMLKWTYLAPVGDNVDKLDADWVAAVTALKAGKVDPANHLAGPLRPIFRRPPSYPASLTGDAKTDGSAVIEAIITPDGRVRLPKVVSASKPEFGWAAATAVQQWCFDPPIRDGKPATIRIQIPFRFRAPQ